MSHSTDRSGKSESIPAYLLPPSASMKPGTAHSGLQGNGLGEVTRFLERIPTFEEFVETGSQVGHVSSSNPPGLGLLAGNASPVKAATFDDDKVPLSRVPWAGVDAMARAQAYGNRKYGDFENYRKGMEISRNLSCAIRHLRDFMNGQDLDAESGEDHLGHAMARIAFVIQNRHDGVGIDDRYSRRTK